MCNREILSRRIDCFFSRSSTTIRGRTPGGRTNPPDRPRYEKCPGRARVKSDIWTMFKPLQITKYGSYMGRDVTETMSSPFKMQSYQSYTYKRQLYIIKRTASETKSLWRAKSRCGPNVHRWNPDQRTFGEWPNLCHTATAGKVCEPSSLMPEQRRCQEEAIMAEFQIVKRCISFLESIADPLSRPR